MKMGFRQITRILSDEIRSGKYKAGALFPRRTDLVKKLGSSRVTIDRAMRHLIQEGLLVSKKGSGTYVTEKSRIKPRIAYIGWPTAEEKLTFPDSCEIEIIDWNSIRQISQRQKLFKFEGLIWKHPLAEFLSWIKEFEGKIPQMIVNRQIQPFNYVSTDHEKAVFLITSQRLHHISQVVPIFLKIQRKYDDLVSHFRENGFVRACRAENLFYEIVEMPEEFDTRIESLKKIDLLYPEKCLLIVSDSMKHTGSVIRWIQSSNRKWKKDVFYSDFDNQFDSSIWGLKVTSFIQNPAKISSLAIQNLVSLLENKSSNSQVLIPPDFVEGDT